MKADFGSKISAIRTDLKFSQARMAKEIGVSDVILGKWERAEAQITFVNLQKLIKTYLRLGILPKGKEQEEAKRLWFSSGESRQFPDDWFASLINKNKVEPVSLSNIKKDIELLCKHRMIFDQPAFRQRFGDELSLEDLSDAINDTQAALDTGKLYSRNDRLHGDFLSAANYQSNTFRETFTRVQELLEDLKRSIVILQESDPKINFFFQHSYYKAIIRIEKVANAKDNIDYIRNQILEEVNKLLRISKIRELPLIHESYW